MTANEWNDRLCGLMIPEFGVDDGYDACNLKGEWRWLVDGVWCRL